MFEWYLVVLYKNFMLTLISAFNTAGLNLDGSRETSVSVLEIIIFLLHSQGMHSFKSSLWLDIYKFDWTYLVTDKWLWVDKHKCICR